MFGRSVSVGLEQMELSSDKKQVVFFPDGAFHFFEVLLNSNWNTLPF